MITAIALALCLQTPRVELKPIWTIGPDFDLANASRPLGNLTRVQGAPIFRFIAPEEEGTLQERKNFICDFHPKEGSFIWMSSVSEKHLGTLEKPDDTDYSIGPTGILQESHWDGTSRSITTLDTVSLKPHVRFVEGLNGYLEPLDDAAATKSILFPAKIRVKNVGDLQLLHDGKDARIAAVDGEVRSYRPGTWELEDKLVAKGDLTSPQRPFLDLRLVGDPESGPFALINGEGGSSAGVFFGENWDAVAISKAMWAYGCGSMGFLVSTNSSSSSPGPLECLDAVTGKRKWIRNDVTPGEGMVHWVGRYAVVFGKRAFDQTGKIFSKLLVLDGETGQTVCGQLLPVENKLWESSGLDDVIILTDDQNRYYGFQIVAK